MCPLTSIWTHVHPSPSHHQEGGETTLTEYEALKEEIEQLHADLTANP